MKNFWEKIDQPENPEEAMEKMAQILHSFYNSLVKAGFHRDEALRLVESNTLGNMIASFSSIAGKRENEGE